MDYKDITPEQMKKLDACETPEDILALAKEEGVDLSDEDIEMISGGRSRTPQVDEKVRDSWKRHHS